MYCKFSLLLFAGWAGLLSKKNLLRCSKQLRDMCGFCNLLPNNDQPCIMSEYLVSMEVNTI